MRRFALLSLVVMLGCAVPPPRELDLDITTDEAEYMSANGPDHGLSYTLNGITINVCIVEETSKEVR